ncbi:unnamed protein product [Discula destructiva]
MWLPRTQRRLAVLLLGVSQLLAPVAAAAEDSLLYTTSLSTCQDNSGFSASLFDVVYTPNNNSLAVDMTASSTVQGYVVFDFQVTAYGYVIIRKTIDPCTAGDGFKGFCPMSPGNLNNPFNVPVDPSAKSQIPSIAYNFPDIDAKVKVFINYTNGDSVACVQAAVSNGKTVDLVAVKWATAIVAGLALASSAIMSGLGHQNAAAHVAANALALCGYFQAQAVIGLVATPLPPSVAAWTQDMQWSLGIIKVDFMQDIFTWYQRSTGGVAANIFDSLSSTSVQVQKRSMALVEPIQSQLYRRAEGMAPRVDNNLLKGGLYRRAIAMMPRADLMAEQMSKFVKRSGNIKTSSGDYVVTGIQRYAYQAGVETTNFFMTGLVWYCIFLLLSALAVVTFKLICEGGVKAGWMQGETFVDFRRAWRTHLKGILFRISLVGFLPVSILCLWELTQGDSPAEMVLAVGFLLGVLISLGWASYNVIRLARRSIALHKNPAYALFSDQHALNKWGFLYIQYRASAYYFIVPALLHLLLKAMFIAFGQGSGVTQAIALIIIEVAALVATSILRPYMDKSTNAINVTICVVNFLNAIFLLIFTNVFNGPGLMIGVVGILLWILNAVVSLILLLILIISTVIIFFKKNPDNRYRMADDRTSFMKSGSVLNTTQQLDALAAAARGDHEGGYYHKARLDEEDDISSTSDLPDHRGVPAAGNSTIRSRSTLAGTEEINEKARPDSFPSAAGSNGSLRGRPLQPISPLESSNGHETEGLTNNAR